MTTTYETYSAASPREALGDGVGYRAAQSGAGTHGSLREPLGDGVLYRAVQGAAGTDLAASTSLPPGLSRGAGRRAQFVSLSSGWATPSASDLAERAEDGAGLAQQLSYLRTERHGLAEELEGYRRRADRFVAYAAADEAAVFILSKIVEARRLHIQEISSRLSVPDGWLAFARLCRADLIDCVGGEVLATEAGFGLVASLMGSASGRAPVV